MTEVRLPALAPVVPPRPGPGGSLLAGLVRTARPPQWVKNLLVFAAPGAAGLLTDLPTLLRAGLAFLVFCLAASGTYFLNDTMDRDADRRHPVNRHRPVAAGVVPPRLALSVAVTLLSGAVLLALVALGPPAAGCVALYVGINAAYNVRLRHEPVLDLAAVASGFVLRAIVGGLATNVHLSEWFLVVTSFASLFIVAGKREGLVALDVAGAPDGARGRSRPVYPVGYLRYVRALSSGVAMAAYCLWAFDKAAGVKGHGLWLQLTIVPFVLAMLRYALLVEGEGVEVPEDVLLGDGTIVALGVAWAVLFALGVYA
ncbi:MAG TPA: decaprenyl-phosphate phosphoribosyltransferase [Acidimicrobiales bacterium]|jgi:decaprenyl-phosphate phosphoribosyltransferase|nr:decaprenyl-phosphate phosphoribosyltransferase [Acidimicrobiales bacterium]